MTNLERTQAEEHRELEQSIIEVLLKGEWEKDDLYFQLGQLYLMAYRHGWSKMGEAVRNLTKEL